MDCAKTKDPFLHAIISPDNVPCVHEFRLQTFSVEFMSLSSAPLSDIDVFEICSAA
jgi:hypothetical protein